jgi:hypothetical protein
MQENEEKKEVEEATATAKNEENKIAIENNEIKESEEVKTADKNKEDKESEVSKESEEKNEDQLSADFIYPPTQLGKAILALLSEENQESEEVWEEFFTAFYDSELWFGAFIEKNEKGEDVLYPIPSAQEDGTESMIVFERGSELAAWYQEGTEESRNDIFLVAKTGDRFLKDIATEAFEKFGNLLISYGRNNHECFIVDEETLKIMREALEDLKTGE